MAEIGPRSRTRACFRAKQTPSDRHRLESVGSMSNRCWSDGLCNLGTPFVKTWWFTESAKSRHTFSANKNVSDTFRALKASHDDVMKWKHFPRNWPFVREIHRSPVNFPHKGQWRGALMFSLIYAWINDWVNNREAGDLRRQHGHYDVIVMNWQ